MCMKTTPDEDHCSGLHQSTECDECGVILSDHLFLHSNVILFYYQSLLVLLMDIHPPVAWARIFHKNNSMKNYC